MTACFLIFFKHLYEVACGISNSKIQRQTCGVKDSTVTSTEKGKEISEVLNRPRLRHPEFLDDHRMKLARLSSLRTGRLCHPENTSGSHFC